MPISSTNLDKEHQKIDHHEPWKRLRTTRGTHYSKNWIRQDHNLSWTSHGGHHRPWCVPPLTHGGYVLLVLLLKKPQHSVVPLPEKLDILGVGTSHEHPVPITPTRGGCRFFFLLKNLNISSPLCNHKF